MGPIRMHLPLPMQVTPNPKQQLIAFIPARKVTNLSFRPGGLVNEWPVPLRSQSWRNRGTSWLF
jgi:hypothetical protein